jgi:SpoVK/Ycf46/Vps4 family AAA+-type ATPase
VNITLETFLNSTIDSYINFAYSKDWDHITNRYIAARTKEAQKLLCIRNNPIQNIVNNKFIRFNDSGTFGDIVNAMCSEAASDSVILYFTSHTNLDNDCPGAATMLKAIADGATENIMITNKSATSGPIDSVAALRRTAVQEVEITNTYKHPRLIIVSDSSEMPSSLSGIALNLGSIDNIKIAKSYSNGMNYRQARYTEHLLGVNTIKEQGMSQAVAQIRKSIFTSSGVVQDILDVEKSSDIGGYEKVKTYFGTVKKYIEKEKSPILKIKGSLFVGPAGTAKSKVLSAIPDMLGLPGYFLDFNRASGSLHGQTERQLIEAIETAKKYAPVVIAIDEIEKAVAGTGEGEVAGNEVATKILGILLTAMSQDSNIYWVASANKVSHLPAPLLRRGRWDHLWYVGLPDETTRAKIFAIHCNKNDVDLSTVKESELNSVLEKMKDYTGAEIRHCIKEASIKGIAENKKVSVKDIIYETSLMKSLVKDHKDTKQVQEWAINNANSVD